MRVQGLSQPSPNASSAQSFLSSLFSVKPNFCTICYDSSQFSLRCPLLANLHFAHLATIRRTNMQNPTANPRLKTGISHRKIGINNFAAVETQAPSSRTTDTRLSNGAILCLGPEKMKDEDIWTSALDKVTRPPCAQHAQPVMPTARNIVSSTPSEPATDKPDLSRPLARLVNLTAKSPQQDQHGRWRSASSRLNSSRRRLTSPSHPVQRTNVVGRTKS